MKGRSLVDNLTPAARSTLMAAVKHKNTKPEMIVRRALHALGYRYRLHRRDLPGSPDIVLPKYRALILVHGCFWHQHEGCNRNKMPSTHTEYWLPKLTRNKERDAENLSKLKDLGWRTLVLWECEILESHIINRRLQDFLEISLIDHH